MAKNKKKKPQQNKEIKKSDIADAAFKKKVTIINGCILLAFIIGLISFLVYSWAKTENYPERFAAEVEAAKQAAEAAQKAAAKADKPSAEVIKPSKPIDPLTPPADGLPIYRETAQSLFGPVPREMPTPLVKLQEGTTVTVWLPLE